METTGDDESWPNIKNEKHNRNIHNMVISGIIDSNKHEKNYVVNQKHHQKSIDESSIVYYTTPKITLNGMVKISAPVCRF